MGKAFPSGVIKVNLPLGKSKYIVNFGLAEIVRTSAFIILHSALFNAKCIKQRGIYGKQLHHRKV